MTRREEHLGNALLRSAKKMMAMALAIESLGTEDGWGEPAIKLRAEAAIAFNAWHKEFDL